MANPYQDVFVDSAIAFLEHVKDVRYHRVTDAEYESLVELTMDFFTNEGLSPSRALCRVGVRSSAYVYPTHSFELKRVLSIFFTYMFMIDDYIACDGSPVIVDEEACRMLSQGGEPDSLFWKSLRGYLPHVLQHYGPQEQLGILAGVYSFWQASMLENSLCDGLPGSVAYPSYLRHKSVMGEACAYLMFPLEGRLRERSVAPGQQPSNNMMAAIVDCIAIIAGINDIFSFYKEVDAASDEVTYVNMLEKCHSISKGQALKKVTEETITLVKRVCGVLKGTGDTEILSKVKDFIMGLVLQHLLDDRYKLREVVNNLEGCGDSRKPTLVSLMDRVATGNVIYV